MSSVLPKKRVILNQNRPNGAVLHDLSNKGRNISNRSVSKRAISGSRHVSRGDMFISEEDANSSFGEDAIHFHENKNTIMSNFEEWIKLSTDNKITSKNSWQFALIDYFHDLNVIKDGDNINFQRASATLDGCVKIYLSRVESAASETGKLLSGLATKKGQLELEETKEDDEDEEDENDDATATRKERRLNRVVESTLVKFDSIKIKKLDQELAIDPLFKKALADFDEGGAKSLLLNTLNIDASGRVVFDATTNALKDEVSEPEDQMELDEAKVDLTPLQNMLFSDSSELETLAICPSLAELKVVLSDVNKAKSVLGGVNNKFMAEEEEEKVLEPQEDEANFPDYDFDMDFDDNNAAPSDFNLATVDDNILISENENTPPPEVFTKERVMDQDLMAYFDERMKTNWRGPEHWRVAALKQSKNLDKELSKTATPQPEAPKRKRKEAVIVDFFAENDEDYLEDIFQKHKNQWMISKRPEERKSEDLHVLPDDFQFNSQRLVNLFIKPAKSIVTFSKKIRTLSDEGDDAQNRTYTDENYFAGKYLEQQKAREEEARQEKLAASFHQAEMDDYDNDNFGGIDFNDVLGGVDDVLVESEDNKEGLGSQFVTGGRKARPEYVNFSRVAKRVDVKLLKDNLWKSIKTEPEAEVDTVEVKPEKNFTEVVEVISEMYRPEEKKDLSTSFCFICLLHLANEHGLSIASNEGHDDLLISGF